MSFNNRRFARNINYVNTLKNIFLISIIGGAIIFQIAWFNSLDSISISYELESYDEEAPEPKTYGEYIDSLFLFMNNHPINITKAADMIININTTFIEELEEDLNETITQAFQIYDAYLNGNLTKSNITTFFEQMWEYAIDLIPNGYLNPAKIVLTNGGLSSIERISFKAKVRIFNKSAVFLRNANQRLSPNEKLIIQLTLKELISTVINLGTNLLIDLTIEILEEVSEVLNTTISYLNELSRKFDLSIFFDMNGLFGLIPIGFEFSVNLVSIFNQLDLPRVLP